jgi:hypothetical protein
MGQLYSIWTNLESSSLLQPRVYNSMDPYPTGSVSHGVRIPRDPYPTGSWNSDQPVQTGSDRLAIFGVKRVLSFPESLAGSLNGLLDFG